MQTHRIGVLSSLGVANDNEGHTDALQLPEPIQHKTNCFVCGAIKATVCSLELLRLLIRVLEVFSIPQPNGFILCHSHELVNGINDNNLQILVVIESVLKDIRSHVVEFIPVPYRLLDDTFNGSLVGLFATGQKDIAIVTGQSFAVVLDNSRLADAGLANQIHGVVKRIQRYFSFLAKFSCHYLLLLNQTDRQRRQFQ